MNKNSAQDEKVEAIFDQAADLSEPDARHKFLVEACAGDSELQSKVERLLGFHENSGEFLETPAVDTDTARGDEQPGTMIGNFRIVERVGEGGFGVVYRAAQQTPVQREVALKVLKLGMDTRRVVARFEHERQTLAMMNHPHIATVLDVGATHSGRPYFVMEFVEGTTLERYCEQETLALDERLRLFLGVCGAVEHAHQKSVVHRDLKPSNVLVTKGETAVPKVIDFGIATALGRPLIDERSVTDQMHMVGTPDFMSPEQVMTGSDVDTRADVYALGAILYRLLTGTTPLNLPSVKGAGLDQVCGMIRQAEPLPPSRRLAQSPKSPVAQQPSARELRGDLDWIVLKALEKDRTRRYQTVSELAQDVERYLNNQPVTARSPSATYRLRKFVSRNRIAVAAAGLVAVAVLFGATLATYGFLQAEREKRDALAAARRTEEVVQLMEQIVGSLDTQYGRPADYTATEQLDEFAAALENRLRGQPLVEARVRRTIGRAYRSLGNPRQAGPQLQRALELREQELGARHPLTAQSRVDYAWFLVAISRYEKAQAQALKALDVLRQAEPGAALIDAYLVLSKSYQENGDFEQASELVSQAWSAVQQVHGPDDPASLVVKATLARTYMHADKLAEGKAMVEEVLHKLRKVRPQEHVDVTLATRILATALRMEGELDQARELMEWACSVDRKLMGDDSVHLAKDLTTLSTIYRRLGDEKAIAAAREAVGIAERTSFERERLLATSTATLARALERSDPAAAAEAWAKSITVERQIYGARIQLAHSLRRRAAALRRMKQLDAAIECMAENTRILAQQIPDNRNIRANNLTRLAEMLQEKNDLAAAEARFRQALEVLGEGHHRAQMVARIRLGQVLVEQEKFADAQSLFTSTQSSDPEDHSAALAAATIKAFILIAQKEFQTAEEILKTAQTNARGFRGDRIRFHARSCLGVALRKAGRYQESEEMLLGLWRKIRRGRMKVNSFEPRLLRNELVKLYQDWNKPGMVQRFQDQSDTHDSE